MEILSHKNAQTKTWTGGTTTELYIFPKDSSYQERNFLFRVSTATIETPESGFTKLPGIKRKIMILDGKITLLHAERYSKDLGKFQTDSFSGDWDTRSIGLATDFNLMTTHTMDGDIREISIKKDEITELKFSKTIKMLLLYAYSGSFEVHGKIVSERDVVVFNQATEIQSVMVRAVTDCEIIVVELSGSDLVYNDLRRITV